MLLNHPLTRAEATTQLTKVYYNGRECSLYLEEAILSLCFAAPRCADLPKLIQVQMAIAAKYGKELCCINQTHAKCGVNHPAIKT